MDYNIHKVCRICLEEGALTSIYSTEFAMMPSTMMMMCAKIRVYKSDGLPAVICNNCIYRLGVAYHFKQECENSDIRLRQYLGLSDRGYGFCDAETNTDIAGEIVSLNEKRQKFLTSNDIDDHSESEENGNNTNSFRKRRRPRYQRKPLEQHKKRGPKPLPKMPHSCYECNKAFKCAAQLQMHMRTHTGEKPYACNYCARRFAQKYNLQIHERTHTGERPFQCEICSKQFSALGNFQAHQKIHSGVRDHICPVCQKAFFSAGDLTKHMATHTGIKNHHCDVCGKAFSRQRDMQSHKRKLHAINEPSEDVVDTDPIVVGGGDVIGHAEYKCPDCDKEFATPESLNGHFRTHGLSGHLLTLPLGTQIPPPLAPHPHAHVHAHAHASHHYHHAVAAAAPPPAHPHDGLTHSHSHGHPHPHAHPHPHHLSINAPIQSNHSSGMAMTHATMAHMLPPPPPPHTHSHGPPPPPPGTPSAQATLSMMHTQRLHPY